MCGVRSQFSGNIEAFEGSRLRASGLGRRFFGLGFRASGVGLPGFRSAPILELSEEAQHLQGLGLPHSRVSGDSGPRPD